MKENTIHEEEWPCERSSFLHSLPSTGSCKRLFDEGTVPAAFRLTHSEPTPGGVIVASYDRAGDVETGSFGA